MVVLQCSISTTAQRHGLRPHPRKQTALRTPSRQNVLQRSYGWLCIHTYSNFLVHEPRRLVEDKKMHDILSTSRRCTLPPFMMLCVCFSLAIATWEWGQQKTSETVDARQSHALYPTQSKVSDDWLWRPFQSVNLCHRGPTGVHGFDISPFCWWTHLTQDTPTQQLHNEQ